MRIKFLETFRINVGEPDLPEKSYPRKNKKLIKKLHSFFRCMVPPLQKAQHIPVRPEQLGRERAKRPQLPQHRLLLFREPHQTSPGTPSALLRQP